METVPDIGKSNDDRAGCRSTEEKMEKTSGKTQFLRGMKAGIPVILGFIPVGIAYAVMARQAGLSVLHTCLMSVMVFAGASQMMAVGMYVQGASIIAMIVATFILNLRHLIMGTCIMSRMREKSTVKKFLAGFGVTDEAFAIFTTEKEENCTLPFFVGLLIVTYLSWNVGTFIGAVASNFLPEIISASLGIALYAMFIGLLMPNLRGNFKLGILVILTAIVNSIISQFIASSWALIISTLLCALIGVFFVDLKEGEENERN